METAAIDYTFIRKLLVKLDACYPESIQTAWRGIRDDDDDEVARLMQYMVEHGLITSSITRKHNGEYTIGRTRITARGIDFLRADGGLSALAAPVVRIATENILAIIENAIASRNDLSLEERSLIKKTLRIAGPEAISAIVQKLVDAGASLAPGLLKLFMLP